MRSPKKKPYSISRKNSKFKVTNWSEYNNILRNRGRIDFMIAKIVKNKKGRIKEVSKDITAEIKIAEQKAVGIGDVENQMLSKTYLTALIAMVACGK